MNERTPAGVPLLDLGRQHAGLEDELVDAFRRVLRSGHFILGPEVKAFEDACARYLGVKHAIGTSSGTDSLLLALMALGVGDGDEVICPTYTFFATAGTIWRTGAKPVFVDSLPCCFNVDPAAVVRAITPRTKAIMPVHLFGQAAELGPVLEAAAAHGISVVEDAAQALGTRWRGKPVGTLGAFGCFSFFPSKNLGGFGDAGLLTTNDDALAERARVLRAHGGKPKYHHAIVGGNFRLDAVQAALLGVKLPHLDGWSRRRIENARRYTDRLVAAGVARVAASVCRGEAPAGDAPQLLLPPVCREGHIYNQYVIRTRSRSARDRLREHLATRKIGTEIYYPVPMHTQACFASLGHTHGEFSQAEAAAEQTLAIPVFPEISGAEVDDVVEAIRSIAPELRA
jgi:dTDP-4-amino-4,6-dideoxygalactose transaminase